MVIFVRNCLLKTSQLHRNSKMSLANSLILAGPSFKIMKTPIMKIIIITIFCTFYNQGAFPLYFIHLLHKTNLTYKYYMSSFEVSLKTMYGIVTLTLQSLY